MELQAVFNDLDIILNEKYQGKVSNNFLNLINETKEDIKTKMQINNKLTSDLSFQIDKAFDEYIENK